MKKIAFISMLGLFLTTGIASATVNATAVTSMVTAPTTVAKSSSIALFSITLTQDVGETLSSVAVNIANTGSSAAVGTDLASVAVYKDEGDGIFTNSDLLVGTQTTVNLGTPTVVTTSSNNTIDGKSFFVVLNTGATWSDASPAHSVVATLPVDAIVASSNSPTLSEAITTMAITADNTAAALQTVVAKNTGGTSAKEAGDSIDLTFNEATNKPNIDATNIDTVLALSNGHSWKDGAGSIGTTAWNSAGTILTITLSAGISLPTVTVSDTVTVSGSVIKDKAGNAATGSAIAITGDFGGSTQTPTPPPSTEGEGTCSNGLVNGRLYKEKGSDKPTVYLAAACVLKPFRGAAVFHARGYKFANIIELDSLTSYTVSQSPAIPSGGTLVKGSKATVWFVTSDGTRKGFVSENAFKRLGFSFANVDTISDSDLVTMPAETPITETSPHPDGTTLKCGNSSTVFEVNGAAKFPFTSAASFEARGHSYTQIVSVDCGKFSYINGQGIVLTSTTVQ